MTLTRTRGCVRAWPRVAPAPILAEHAGGVGDLFDHQGPCRHVQHDRTGLIVLPNQRLAQSARGLFASADKPTRSRVRSDAPGREDAGKRRRRRVRLQDTTPPRRRRRAARVGIAATLCEHVGNLVDDVDRPDHPGDGTSPRAPNPGPRFAVSGPVRVPRALRR
jgi:hypothetical protein